MSTDSDSRSWFVRFCDTFFQEQNIKYMLGVGMLILLGSSLMLVTSNWESYTPAWKYLILIAYTAAIHGAGQVTYHSLGLRKTGTGLMSLTVLLLPLSFLAVRWIDPSESFTLAGLAHHAALAALLGVNVVFTALAARRIFRHFLRRTQPTFLISYLTLCLAGAVVLVIPVEFAPWTTLALWCVFAAGSIKVNRHVFWLSEEQRLPRICGFFPILLLGGMFLTLFTLNLAGHVPLMWIGFGCVLVAIPVLLAADAVADVFQKRGYLGGDEPPLCRERTPCRSANGENGTECDSADGEKITECNASERHGVRSLQDAGRLPWSVAIPMWIGLALTATGVCLSAVRFPETYGLAPTAVLAATMLALTARRTGRSAFVWVMLIGVLIAYQASPVFFRELASYAIHHGAAAVNEDKLPLAFYGLTYLPLLAGTALIALWRERRRDRLFAPPLRQFTVGLSLLLLAVSLTHVKAIFPSGAALTFVFLTQALLFRDRRLLIPAAIAWTTATLGSAPFLEDVLELRVSSGGELLVWTGSAALLFAVGQWLDRSTLRFAADESDWTHRAPLTQIVSFGLLLVPTAAWLAQCVFSPGGSAPWLPATVIGLMLLVHAVRWRRIGVVDLALAFPVVATALIASSNGLALTQVAGLIAVLASLLWTCGCFLQSARARDGLQTRPTLELRAAFAGAASRVSTIGLGLLLAAFLLPLCGLWMLSADSSPWFRLPGGLVTWIPVGLIVLWSFDAARRQWAGWIVPGWIAAMAFSGAVVVEQGAQVTWLPAVWAGLTLLAVPKVGRSSRVVDEVAETSSDSSADTRSLRDCGYGQRHANVARLLSYCTFFTFSLIALSSLLFFTTAFRVAGAVSLCGLLCLAAMLQQRVLRTLALMLVNWQVLCVVVQVVLQTIEADVTRLFTLGWESFYYCALPVALAAALQALVWERARRWLGTAPEGTRFLNQSNQRDPGLLHDLINFHSVVLQLIAGFSLLVTLPGMEDGLTIHQVGCAVLTFAALAALRVAAAIRTIAAGEQRRLSVAAESPDFRRIREHAEVHVWLAIVIAAAAAGYLCLFGEFTLNSTECLFGLLASGVVASLISSWSLRSPRTAILAGPLRTTALWLPGMTVFAGVTRHFAHDNPEWLGLNSLALLLAAGFYFWRGLEQKKKSFAVLSAGIVNIALALLWRERNWSDPQFYMIPLGATLLALVELLKPEIPRSAHDPLRYIGALTILVSPTFHIVGGSWLHLLSLMVASVLITLLAMGLRVRALMYMGTGFLVADIIAMVVRGSIDRPSILWIAGIFVGASVITLAAWCERHREQLLQRLRLLSAELQTWE